MGMGQIASQDLPHEVAFSASSVLVLLLQPFSATSHAIPRERLPC